MDQSFASVIFTIGRLGPAGVDLLGTGFAVGRNKIATAAHLTGQNNDSLVALMPQITQMSEYQDTTINQARLSPVTISAYDPIHDIAILDAPEIVMNFGYSLGGTDESPPGTRIVSAGFPHADLGRRVLTQQSSTVGARILMAAGPVKAKHIVMNVQTRPGTSGSPVFLEGQPRVCGMLIGSYVPQGAGGIRLGNIDPYTLHQTTHAVSAEYIKAML
jgi:V8-like Glu-specific endopeptidase